MNNNSTDFID